MDRNYPVSADACSHACRNGQLACLERLHSHGALWDVSTVSSAAAQGHIDCLRFALEQGCPYKDTLIIGSVQSSNTVCLRYLVEEQGLFLFDNGFLFLSAFAVGNYLALQYLIDQGCPFQHSTPTAIKFAMMLLRGKCGSSKTSKCDFNMLKCLYIAYHHHWDMLSSDSEITTFIASNRQKLPRSRAFLISEGIVSS